MKIYTFPLNHFITQLVSVSFLRFSRKAESSSKCTKTQICR